MKKIFIIILIISIAGGGYWYFFLKGKTTTESDSSVFSSFFPKGDTVGVTNYQEEGSSEATDSTNPVEQNGSNTIGKLEQLTTSPVAGFTAFSIKKSLTELSDSATNTDTRNSFAFNSFVRYVARGNGFVYEIKNNTTPVQITNVYIPNIYEAQFVDSNKTALLRFLRDDQKTIATYSVPVPEQNTDGTRTQITGVFLPDNANSVAISPDQKSLAILTQKQDLGVITLMNSLGINKVDLISNPFSEWIISWPNTNSLYAQTKSAGSVPGFLYKIDRKDIRFKKVLGGINGLTTNVSPSGRYVIYSESTEGSFNTTILNTQTNQKNSLTLSILPEKCTWDSVENLYCAGEEVLESKTYPDAWYAGIVRFNDTLVKINTSNNAALTVVYKDSSTQIDATNLVLDESIGYLYFINKNDATLWRVRTY